MQLIIGFAVGVLVGLMFWFQSAMHEAEIWDEYLKLQRELMLTRRQLYAMDRTSGHGWPDTHDTPTTKPSRN